LKEPVGDILALYVAEWIRLPYKIGQQKNCDFDYNHERVMMYLNSKSHSYYDELDGLKWRINGKKTYPIPPPPFPSNPDIIS